MIGRRDESFPRQGGTRLRLDWFSSPIYLEVEGPFSRIIQSIAIWRRRLSISSEKLHESTPYSSEKKEADLTG
jgi:hypothetical protein